MKTIDEREMEKTTKEKQKGREEQGKQKLQ